MKHQKSCMLVQCSYFQVGNTADTCLIVLYSSQQACQSERANPGSPICWQPENELVTSHMIVCIQYGHSSLWILQLVGGRSACWHSLCNSEPDWVYRSIPACEWDALPKLRSRVSVTQCNPSVGRCTALQASQIGAMTFGRTTSSSAYFKRRQEICQTPDVGTECALGSSNCNHHGHLAGLQANGIVELSATYSKGHLTGNRVLLGLHHNRFDALQTIKHFIIGGLLRCHTQLQAACTCAVRIQFLEGFQELIVANIRIPSVCS